MLPLRGLVTRRADIIGIQSVYFRIRVKDVLTRFAGDPSRPVCPPTGWRDRGGLGLGHLRATGQPRGGP